MDIHWELYIKDGFSEPYQPNQNLVESKAIKWLKQASHVLLDYRGAPDTAWYFAIKYLADVHSICYNKSIGMSPCQWQTGVTPDISAYLQFKFWPCILYLDHEESWQSSNEQSGYWVGIAHNVRNALTYWIFDDQMKQLVACSVVRPYWQNCKVEWDPAFANVPFHNTTRNGGDIMLNKSKHDHLLAHCEDMLDALEPEPTAHILDPITTGQHNLPTALNPPRTITAL